MSLINSAEQSETSSVATASVATVSKSLDEALRLASLGAFIYIDSAPALEAARLADESAKDGQALGPLHGLPIVVKDNIHVAGMPNTAGTLSLKNFVPEKSNATVSALVNAGAIVIGKTNMHELAFGLTSNNAAFGPVRNVVDPSLIAGGSSGGTAVAVASGIVAMGLGTDTGGSVRVPSALNGVVGLRPTLGRYNSEDVTPIASTRDTVGPIANTVRNVALMDSVITGIDAGITEASLMGLRLGVPREYFYQGLSSDIEKNIEAVLESLTQAGVELVDVELPQLQVANDGVSFPVALHEFITEMPQYLQKYKTGVSLIDLVAGIASPDVKGAAESQLSPDAISLEVYADAINIFRPQLQAIYSKGFSANNVDAFIVPATPCVAQPILTSDETVELNGAQASTFVTYKQNADPTSNAGLPSLALPSGKSKSGLPIGILLDGPENSDRRLLEIGLAIESLLSVS